MKNISFIRYNTKRESACRFQQKFLLLLLFLFFNTLAGYSQSVKFVANPANSAVLVGQTFNVAIEAQFTGMPNLNSLQLILDFDETYLEVLSLTPQMGILQTTLISDFNNVTGRIRYAAGVSGGNPPVNTNFTILTIQFKAKAAVANTVVTYITTGNPRTRAVGGVSGSADIWDASNSTPANITICPAATGPEINLQGNATTINDGDVTPSLTDHTDFGNVTTSTFTRTFTIQNTGAANLSVTGFLTSGDVSQFSLGALMPASPIPAGMSATFTVTYTPTSLGTKSLNISIQNDDCNENVYDFKVQANGDIYLPVELLDFNGKAQDKAILLDWVTASEKENAGFEVQRSANGIKWQKIGFEKGYGTTSEQKNYKYTDNNPLGGINYYRLRQLDFDSTETFHKTIAVPFDGKVHIISIFPNPSFDRIIVQRSMPSKETGVIKITDLLGRTLLTFPIESGFTTEQIDISQLPAATYIITLETKTEAYKTKFVKSVN